MLLLPAALSIATPAPTGIDGLEQRLKRTPPISTPFVEFRFSHLLKRPLRSSGVLEYRADGVMARSVEKPHREHTEIVGNEVRMRRGDKPERRMSLERAPQMRLLLGSFRALLEGRLAPLGVDFQTTLEEHGDHWLLTLKPRDARLARSLARIDVHGAADRPVCLESVEPDGDATLTLFTADVPEEPRPDRAALERRCRIAATARAP